MAIINHPSKWDFTRMNALFAQQQVINPYSEWDFTRMKELGSAIKGEFDDRVNRQDLFDPVMGPFFNLPPIKSPSSDSVKKVVGGGMVVVGTGILAPGAGDAAAGVAGVLFFKHPLGFPAGVAIYNITGLGLVWIGYNWQQGYPTFQSPFG
jgi:hypothetical protein